MPDDNAAFRIARARWRRKSVLGVKDEKFWPITQEVIDAMLDPELEREWLELYPQYRSMREILERQRTAVEELIASGNLQNPEWIRQNVHVLTDDEVISNEVYAWLNDYLKTPEGQRNLACALVSERGGSDNQIKIKFGSVKSLNGAGGWADADHSRVQLSKENWQRNRDHESSLVLPHEIRHLGQEDIRRLSQREYFLYQAGLVEADARLTEYCDGITEGRNKHYKGYRGLKQDFKAVLEELGEKNVKSFEDFVQLKDTDRQKYDLIMGRLKEREFLEVLNHLCQTPLYLRQGSDARWRFGDGNLPALRAWCEDVCECQGMRFEKVWPEIGAMATGKKEIPGMEGGFNAKGKLTSKGREILREAKKLDMSRGEIIRSQVTGKIEREVICRDTGESEELFYDENERVIRKVEKNDVGRETSSVFYTYDEKGYMITSKEMFADGVIEETDFSEDGRIIRTIFTDGKRRTERQYDNNSGRALGMIITEGEEVVARESYLYDEKGREVAKIRTNSEGGSSRCEYTYHENGKRASNTIVWLDDKGNEIQRIEQTYDEQGRYLGLKSGNKTQTEDTTSTSTDRDENTQTPEILVVPRIEPVAIDEAIQEIDKGKESKVDHQNNQEKSEKGETVKVVSRQRKTADKTSDKPYYGRRDGGIDDLIAKVNDQEHVMMNSACNRRKHTQS